MAAKTLALQIQQQGKTVTKETLVAVQYGFEQGMRMDPRRQSTALQLIKGSVPDSG